MGRLTFATIGRPLPGRPTVVVSRNPAFRTPGVTLAHSVEQGLIEADRLAGDIDAPAIMVAGGATLYRALLPQAHALLITDVDCSPEGDTVFPRIEPDAWRETNRRDAVRGQHDSAPYAFVRYERR